MTRRRLAWIVLVSLGVLAAVGAVWGMFGPDRVTLTASQLQERVNRMLPRQFKGGVTVDQATVTVTGGQVALWVETRAAALGQSLKATVSARGVPSFSAERGEVFFDADEIKVMDFAVTGGSVAGRLERLGALRERVETAAGNAIAAGIKAYLAERPVYRFKDDLKGIVLKATISDIATRDDAIVITISVVTFNVLAAVSVAALLTILFLIVQLYQYPNWGLSAVDAARWI